MVGKEEDPERLGRWNTLRIQITGTVISVITAYRVCKTQINLEISTAYVEQPKEMATRTCRMVDPWVKFLVDPKRYVMPEIEEKREVLIVMDANESAECRTDEMLVLTQECGMVDTYLIANLYTEVKTYAEGKAKIDFIPMGPIVQQCIMYTQIVPYKEWIISHHRVLVVYVDYKTLEMGDLVFWQRSKRSLLQDSGNWRFWKQPKRSFTSNTTRSRRTVLEECCQKIKIRMDPETRDDKEKQGSG